MNNIWKTHITSKGAQIQGDFVSSFEPMDDPYFTEEETYLCDCSSLGVIKATGEEAQSFLHSQFTNDLNQVNDETSQLSGYCNAKGRLLSIFRIFKYEENYLLLLNKDVLDNTLSKLNMYKLMAKTEISNNSDDYVVFGLTGKKTDSILKKNNITFPSNNEQCTNYDGSIITRIDADRVLIIAEPKKAIELWNLFETDAVPRDYSIWKLLDIQNGIPEVTKETMEAFIPQMVNLELINGVNFQKGCYPGQEIVARTHYLGKPNRRMYKIELLAENNSEPGTNIYSEDDGEQAVGKIVSSVQYSSDNIDALIVLRTANEKSENLKIGSLNGPTASISNLPYKLDQA